MSFREGEFIKNKQNATLKKEGEKDEKFWEIMEMVSAT